MEDVEKINPDYLKGYNEGYLIAKHEPALAAKLAKINSLSPRIVGLSKGVEEYNLEKDQERLPAWLKSDRLSSLNKTEPEKSKEDKDIS